MKNKPILFLIFTLFYTPFAFAQIHHWETAIYDNDVWGYRLGTAEPLPNWKTLDFAGTWAAGQGSIGYGDGDDNTSIPPVGSLYMRHEFTITDPAKIETAILHADYDDAFVAYWNGIEIARSGNIEGTPPPHTAWATYAHEADQAPEAFFIASDFFGSFINSGENLLAIQVHNFGGASSSDLTSSFFLSFGIKDATFDYGTPPAWFDSPGFTTHLPIIKINTGGVYIPDEPAIAAQMGIVWQGEGILNHSLDAPNHFLGDIEIDRRGQSSLWVYPKNGYAIETKDEEGEDMDVSFLNFPEEEDWVLHGPYSDKTLMRNVLTMHLAQSMGQYASRTRFVELVINEQYEGVYVLMEKIKRDESRLDIANLKEEDIEGVELTGGYIFKIDKGEPDWYSPFDMVNNPGVKLHFQYVFPKKTKIQPQQVTYIQAYVDSFERAIHSPDWHFDGKRYDEFIDLSSFADNFILNELSKNVDAYRFSTYFHKKKDSNGGKIHAGPVWDFNFAWGNGDYCEGFSPSGWIYDVHCGEGNPFWWRCMFQDAVFMNIVKCRWETLRQGALHLDSIHVFIDEQAELLGAATDRNFERWDILGEYVWPNPVVVGSFGGEVSVMKNFIEDRLFWMDNNIMGECTPTTIVENIAKPFEVHPNPASDRLTIYFAEKTQGIVTISLTNMLGELVQIDEYVNPASKLTVELGSLPIGTYFLSLDMLGERITKRVLVMR